MEDIRSKKDYGGKALLPILVFLGLYLGCGTYFSIKGVESPLADAPIRCINDWNSCSVTLF